ncbi:restriction endonuclease subunit S [Megalodesulfovibrio gigas]|uniref:Putative restriction modification system DNA specificity subunit n=1 Tax=Megalodesulfovibrio gigas (strain ATCC 19364 / DSM 1382 / NCIMB 9332 / VKM B-1759) TaxID=1121448 RepID=T2GAK8_MEGG1|nr:restriction endonuclease subunit S [Megalodesulfovibrio gigas]AGW13151.1 putative restriction modification system DNA specificity subunit [Megalodesulfovibrio gigas DSM 1382 = ATCC 19364]
MPSGTYTPYPRYKDSGVEWLGDVPEGWEVKRLRFISRINPLASELQDFSPEDEVSFVPMECVCEYGGLRLEQTKPMDEIGSGYTYFRDGDVVFAKITPCFENGKGTLAEGLVNGVAFGTTELHVIRPDDTLEKRFLFYLTICDNFRKIGESEMYGAGGQKRVPTDFVQNFPVPLPPLPEQAAIAAFLDRETARLDALVARKRRLIELLQEKRAAVISHAVTRGLDPAAPIKDSGVDWLGEVPAHWEVKRLAYLAEMSGGMTPDKSNETFWEGDIPWLTPKDMKRPVIDDTEDKITHVALTATGIKLYDAGHVFIVVRGMILAHTFPVCINSVETTVNQDVKALNVLRYFIPQYFAFMLQGIDKALLALVEEAAHGTRCLRTEVWHDFYVAFPDKDEQLKIVSELEKHITRIDALITKINTAITTLQEYRTALITAAVTGKIDVREEGAC